MQTAFLTYRSSVIHYAYTTGGNTPMVCLHGYGENCLSFSFLEKSLPATFSMIAIDLPFHGKTEWKEESDFTPDDLHQITKLLIAELYRLADETGSPPNTHNSTPKTILLGFSLGGRLALSLYQSDPGSFNKIILLAPDGLKENAWYRFATQTIIGNRLFRLTMQKPGWFFGLLKVANRLGFVNSSIFKFVHQYIGDPEVRKQLYQRWTGLRKCRPDLKKIRSMIRNNRTSVKLVYGKHDRIILASPGEKFSRSIRECCSIRVIDSGHQILHPRYSKTILEEIMG